MLKIFGLLFFGLKKTNFYFLLVLFQFSLLHCITLDKNRNIPEASISNSDLYFCTTRSLNNGALRIDILKKLQQLFKIEIFIETGTYLGDTCEVAKQVFREVHSIELSEQLCMDAKKRFQSEQNVFLYCGDSSEVFRIVLPFLKKRALFYLDGHYSGHITARGNKDTPIIQELEAIRDSEIIDSVILIDDIRGFQKSNSKNKLQSLNLGLENYPELDTVISSVLEINPKYQICFLGDSLLAFSSESGVSISPVLKACTTHRLAQFYTSIKREEVEMSLNIIAKAENLERNELDVYYNTYSFFELEYGYPSYACYWKGLLLIEEGKKELGNKLILQAAESILW